MLVELFLAKIIFGFAALFLAVAIVAVKCFNALPLEARLQCVCILLLFAGMAGLFYLLKTNKNNKLV